MRGIDRYFERYYAKGPRRRPVRVEFCEADVLDVFDEWRRAVGDHWSRTLQRPIDARRRRAGSAAQHRRSLPAHLERVVARLTALAQRGRIARSMRRSTRSSRELDVARAGAKAIRGDARQALIERLRALDTQLLDAARARSATRRRMRRSPPRPTPSWRRFASAWRPRRTSSHGAPCVDRLLRERRRLPMVAFE